MTDHTIQRAHGLVEELRAEVDFEIDDVITNIVRNLPEEYFESLSHEDQLTHLKALLAISICQLKKELILHSEDGRHVVVVARKNYPGLLAKIISRLPDDQRLIGAQIFTSKEHDFIIDLFEFYSQTNSNQPDVAAMDIEDTINSVVNMTGKPAAAIERFVKSYPPGNGILTSPQYVREHFLAVTEAESANEAVVRWGDPNSDGLTKLTIASGGQTARELFLKSAQFLATQSIDIEQAFLHDFDFSENHVAVSSFLVDGSFSNPREQVSGQLIGFLNQAK